MQVVREQITRALAMKPSSIDQLKNKLRGLNYSEILRLRQSERMSQDDFQSPPIMLVRVYLHYTSFNILVIYIMLCGPGSTCRLLFTEQLQLFPVASNYIAALLNTDPNSALFI